MNAPLVSVCVYYFPHVLLTDSLSQIAQLDREKHEVVSQLNEVRVYCFLTFTEFVSTSLSERSVRLFICPSVTLVPYDRGMFLVS